MKNRVIFFELRSRNHRAFRILFNRYYEELVGYAHSYVMDVSASEDIVQESYIKLWEKAGSLSINTSLQAYLYTMVRNKCIDFLRAVQVTYSEDIEQLNAILLSDYQPEITTGGERNRRYEKVMRVVDNFPERMKLIFKLKFFNHYRYAEIAEELNISINTVKTQLKRAKVKIDRAIVILGILIYFFWR